MKDHDTRRSIMFATDLSKNSSRAVEWVRWLRERSRATAYIVHVLDPVSKRIGSAENEKDRERVQGELDRFTRKNGFSGGAFRPVLFVGDRAVVLAQFAKRHGVGVAILENHAIGLNRFLAGSISEEIYRSVSCPVLTVGPLAQRPPTGKIVRVLFATSLDKPSPTIFGRIRRIFGDDARLELTLAHFVPEESKRLVERYQTRRDLQAELVQLVPDQLRERIRDVIVECCSPVQGILELSRAEHVDLILLAVRDAGPFTRLATHRTGSIVHKIIERAACPVLTIRK